MPSRRHVLSSLLVGTLHAGCLLLVALDLGYSVGPSNYSVLGLSWRYGGLVVVAAVPVWLVLRYRLVAPLVALIVTTGYVLGMELTPPGPTFRDVAELERLAEPTGIIVVENGLYIVRYMINASVWTVGFLFVGLLEYATRTRWERLPDVSRPISWLSIPAHKRRAAGIAAIGGLLHATVMVWFAYRLGVTMSSGFEVLLYLYGAVGMWLLAAIPLYLLVRHRLLAPATLLTMFVLRDVQAEFAANPDDPHAFYIGAWFVFLGLVLVVGGIEYVLRRIGGYQRLGSLT
ncbi:hypothetical protein ACFQE8_21745 [Salinirubellus sp. GCM10025818]|uniref:hypothetical protein n=1 Tax=Salinirubellus TaxID=2162630 RepID=UPI0030CFC60D